MSAASGKGEAAIAWCPYPDVKAARQAAQMMLDEGLVACANIIPAIESVFEWEGKVDSAAEVAVLFKTTANKLDQLVTRLGECHPYDTPAVLGWRCESAAPETKAWLAGILG